MKITSNPKIEVPIAIYNPSVPNAKPSPTAESEAPDHWTPTVGAVFAPEGEAKIRPPTSRFDVVLAPTMQAMRQ